MRMAVAALSALLVASPAAAQGQLRMVPVPADAGVVVPPRGAAPFAPGRSAPPSPELWERLRTAPPPAPPPPTAATVGLPPVAAVLLPLAAAALLGATVPGSGGGGGGVAPPVTAAPP